MNCPGPYMGGWMATTRVTSALHCSFIHSMRTELLSMILKLRRCSLDAFCGKNLHTMRSGLTLRPHSKTTSSPIGAIVDSGDRTMYRPNFDRPPLPPFSADPLALQTPRHRQKKKDMASVMTIRFAWHTLFVECLGLSLCGFGAITRTELSLN